MKGFFCALFFSLVSVAGFTQDKDCFRAHLREAITINQWRRPYYSDLTKGKSNKIFRFLITSEKASLLVARSFDRKAQVYQEQGIPLFCEEFMPMNGPLDLPRKGARPLEAFRPIEWKWYRNELGAAVQAKNFDLIRKVSLKGIKDLQTYPNYYCMMRHILESVYRIAHFAPQRIEASLKAGLPSPEKLLLKLIRLHVMSLISSNQIDQWSAPIQREGIPILCAELPRLMDDLEISQSLEALDGI